MAGLVIIGNSVPIMARKVEAESCPDLKIVFARGSGEERWKDQNYLEFKARIEEKLPNGISYEFVDLDYPAIGVGLDNIFVSLRALFGAGEAYEFGDSVNAGVAKLKQTINSGCAKTKYVIGGYSQGAMVISKALPGLDANRIIYAATFGDPKIYLPEGVGPVPAACAGKELSDYRIYVPDCRAFEGLLGSYQPYQPEGFKGKLGTWCNKYDIFCSSYFSIGSHTAYVSDNLYEDASRVIASKVATAFEVKNNYSSPHDTAILIDSTGSMEFMIDQFKDEALRLADETFKIGGRVALYDYRDLDDPYEPTARCSFETCTTDNFAELLNRIVTGNGGDDAESMLSASVKAMNELKWRQGATKSLVILTDAPFLSPDRDGTTMQDVIELSKKIDPVNIYIVTNATVVAEHPEIQELANSTDGTTVTDFDKLNLLTDHILERYDALPRVEEEVGFGGESAVPTLKITDAANDGDSVTVNFEQTGSKVLVILNDAVLGITKENFVIINGLNLGTENELTLIPMTETRRGQRKTVEITVEIKAPDTGIAR